MNKQYYVYILANQRNGTIYTGITSDLSTRVQQHRSSLNKGFTQKYGIHKLVYYEVHQDPQEAIFREKKIKKWKRKWKLELIEKQNPDWLDLSNDFAY